MDADTKFRRFCYLGTFEPVYIYKTQSIDVDALWPLVGDVCLQLTDVQVLQILKVALTVDKLVRNDEALFAYACYLESKVDMKYKLPARQAFPTLITNDDDLFLFCKYNMRVREIKIGRKARSFSTTVRKAIAAWYRELTPEAVMAKLLRRSSHGFTHRGLLVMCHVSDEVIGSKDIVDIFFKSCKQARNDSTTAIVDPSANNKTTIPDDVKPPLAIATKANETAAAPSGQKEMLVALSQLRRTVQNQTAVNLIRKFNIRYDQIPGRLLHHIPIMEAAVPSMSYLQLLKRWRFMAGRRMLRNGSLFKVCKQKLGNMDQLRKENIHPATFLLLLRKMGIERVAEMTPQKVEDLKAEYMFKTYKGSYNADGGNKLRMLITINLQATYKRKKLRYQKNLTFFDITMALAFGYFKREGHVDVYNWCTDKVRLEKIDWHHNMDQDAAAKICNKKLFEKNVPQRLILPLLEAFRNKEKTYDVFLCITPSAGRSNPNQNSDFLCKFLDRYRENRNPNAKFIILDILKNGKSMQYSTERNENILEICGFDENTADLITNFVMNRFG